MDASLVVHKRKERLVIIGAHIMGYVVEDLDTGVTYLIDRAYFEKQYEAIGTIAELAMSEVTLDDPIHTEVWKKLQEQGETIQKLRNRINTVMNDMRYERKENAELRKQLGMRRKPPYRNGRKRGSRGRNG